MGATTLKRHRSSVGGLTPLAGTLSLSHPARPLANPARAVKGQLWATNSVTGAKVTPFQCVLFVRYCGVGWCVVFVAWWFVVFNTVCWWVCVGCCVGVWGGCGVCCMWVVVGFWWVVCVGVKGGLLGWWVPWGTGAGVYGA